MSTSVRLIRFLPARAVVWAGLASGLLAAGWAVAAHAAEPRASQPAAAAIDWERAQALFRREQQGEKLSTEEQAYLDRAKAERRRGGGRGPQAATRPADGGKASTGLVPLTDLAGDRRHHGVDGGLYGGGRNDPPDDHRRAAGRQAALVVPLDAAGKPAADGRIVLMSIGMSNTTQEFSRFKQAADRDPAKSPALVIVDAAQGGQDAPAWAEGRDGVGAKADGNRVWAEAERRLAAAGVAPQQVQVVWVKQAVKGQGRLGEFPAHAKSMQADLVAILNVAKARYPNLRLAYLSSRIYAGYAVTQLNPEPYAYEGAFAVRWVIEEQIRGAASLNYDPVKGDVQAPLALWGPYLWADGTKGRAADNLVWRREDLAGDGTHPSDSGRQKVAELLLKFFTTDETARPWFVKAGN